MCKKITAILLALVLFSAVASGADRMFTLVIDAGHGGHDAGAVGAFSSEKDINLSVALAFGRYVERKRTRPTCSSQSIPTPCLRAI